MLRISLDSLQSGMVLEKSIYAEDGQLLLGRGVVLDGFFIRRLKAIGINSVFIREEQTADILPHDNIPDLVRGSTLRHLRRLFGVCEDLVREVRYTSVSAIRDAVTSEQFQSTFRNHPAVRKLLVDIELIVHHLIKGEIVLGLNSIKSYDNYTFQHSMDVTVISILIGRRIGLSSRRLRELGMGCLLHDIGKTFISRDILNKPGPLTPDEIERMKLHPLIGFELVRGVESIGILPPHVVLQHHEKQDGSGYPRGLTGKNRLGISDEPRTIHLYAGIAAVADIFDALTSDRPYRAALPPEEAVKIIRSMSGESLNREILRAFLAITPVFPVGSTVRVVRGRYPNHIGVVSAQSPDHLDRPVVRLLFDGNRRRIAPVDLDLAGEEGTEIVSVLL